MTATEFVYWLQGFFEISNAEGMTKEQVQIVKDHISLVLTKVTPAAPVKSELEKYLANRPDCSHGVRYC